MTKNRALYLNASIWMLVMLLAVSLCACSSMEEKRDKFLASGQGLYQEGDYVRARLQFQNALQIDPKFGVAQLWLGKTELKLQNPRGAYGALNKAVELNPQLTEAQVLLGDILLMAKQLDKAQEHAEIALKQEPQNTDALLLSASLSAVRGQPQQALNGLAEVRRLDPGKIEAYLLATSVLMKEKQPEEAAAILEQGIKVNPKSIKLYVFRANLAEQQKQFEVAESFLLQAITLDPKNLALSNQLVSLYARSGEKDKAEKAIRQLISLDPNSEKPAIMLARFLAGQGRRQEAETTLQGFIKAHPDNIRPASAWQNFTRPCDGQGRPSKSWMTSSNSTPTARRGCKPKTNWRVFNWPRTISRTAEKLVNEVLKDHPKDMQATEIRGIIALGKKDGLTAVNSFRLLTQDRPQDPKAWLLLAQANLLNKEDGLAKENAKKALAIKPDFLEARKFLYGIFLQAKDYDGAINTIQGYLRLNGKDVANLVTLGEVYAVKGDYAQARGAFQKIIDQEPQNPQGYFQMARLSLKTKKTDEALKYANKALQEQPNFLPALQLVAAIYQDQKQPDKAWQQYARLWPAAPKTLSCTKCWANCCWSRSSPRPPSPPWKKP